MKRDHLGAGIMIGVVWSLAACGGGDEGPDRSAWLGQYDVAWGCNTAGCTTVPDVSVSTTVTVVAAPNTEDRINLAFMPAASSSGIIGLASPDGDAYRITQLFDGNGTWSEMPLVRTGTGFTGSATYMSTAGSGTEWTLTATGPR